MIAATAVEEEDGSAPKSREDNIHPAVVINVSKGCTAPSEWRAHPGIGEFEVAFVIHRQKRQHFIFQRRVDVVNVVEHVTLRNEQILPAVVVEIFEAHAPAGAARG